MILQEDLAGPSYSALINAKRSGLLILLILKATQILLLKAEAQCTE